MVTVTPEFIKYENNYYNNEKSLTGRNNLCGIIGELSPHYVFFRHKNI